MRKSRLIFIAVAVIFMTAMYPSDCRAEINEKPFKVIGYYSGDLFDEPVEKLQTGKLTHVIYAFLIPQEDGTLVDLEKPEQLKQLVAQAHNDGAKVFIAVGGWSYQNQPLQPVFETIAASGEKRKLLVENICAFVNEYGLDGVELDWEHPHANSIADYERLTVELKSALDLEGRELSAALNGAWSKTEGPEASMLMTDTCLKSFSFINVMAYDMNNQDHSPLWLAETSIDYWLNRGGPAANIVLGMPLNARPSWLQYRELVELNPEYAYTDYAATSPLESYYNGINTLREKTVVALSKAGGVMLFDVNEDTSDETSVVSMIDSLIARTGQLSPDEMNQYVTIILDHRELPFLAEEGLGVPYIDENNRIMMPLRKPLEAMGAAVSYNNNSRTVAVEKNGTAVTAVIDENVIHVNGKPTVMDTKAIIKENRTYIPLRYVFEAFGYNIEWHGNSRTAIISQLQR